MDVAAGLVSPERAADVYGVVIRGGVVDGTETLACRAGIAAGRGALPAFDFGPGRNEWEGLYGVTAERIAAWLPELPEGVRRHAQAEVHRRLREGGPGPYGEAAERAMAATAAAFVRM